MRVGAWTSREALKRGLAPLGRSGRPRGCTILTYHRVGGGTPDERDVPLAAFERQLDVLVAGPVVPLDVALDRLSAGDDTPTVVLTFDDGFVDVHRHAWPRLRDRGLPFTLYLATGYVGGELRWEGSTARTPTGPALSWRQVEELAASPLVTIGNHTHTHVPPPALTVHELAACDDAVAARLGRRPRHFAYPWGIVVPAVEEELRARYRSAVTGRVGRNRPGDDPYRLRRVPVRRTDPVAFFAQKVDGGLGPERVYGGLVATAKLVGLRG